MALLLFNALGVAVVYFTQRLQVSLPLNPQALANVTPDFGLRHGREFRDQHQLAGLFRRIHDELFSLKWLRWPCRISSPRPPASRLRLR